MGWAAGSSRRRTASLKGPVAFTTTFASSGSSRPVSSSRATRPRTTSFSLDETNDRRVVGEGRPEGRGGLGEVDREPGVVELAVVIDDAASEAAGLDGGKPLERFFAGEVSRRAEAELSREGVVDAEADAVERSFPPVVVGNDEGELVDEVRRVLAQPAPFLEGFQYEGDVSLLEVAHAAVHELGAAAGGAAGEIPRFQERRPVAARGGVDGAPEPGGAAADNDDVPAPRRRLEPVENRAPFQAPSSRPDCTPSEIRDRHQFLSRTEFESNTRSVSTGGGCHTAGVAEDTRQRARRRLR